MAKPRNTKPSPRREAHRQLQRLGELKHAAVARTKAEIAPHEQDLAAAVYSPAATAPDSDQHPIIRKLRRRCDVADQARRDRDPADQDYLGEIDYWRNRREELLASRAFITVVDVIPKVAREKKAAELFRLLCAIQRMIECALTNVDPRSWKQQFLPWDTKRELATSALRGAADVLGDATYAPVIMGIARQLELEQEPPEEQHVTSKCFNPEYLAKAGGGQSDSQWFGLFVKQLAEYVLTDVETRYTTRAAVIAELLRVVGMTDATSKRVNAILRHAESYHRKRD